MCQQLTYLIRLFSLSGFLDLKEYEIRNWSNEETRQTSFKLCLWLLNSGGCSAVILLKIVSIDPWKARGSGSFKRIYRRSSIRLLFLNLDPLQNSAIVTSYYSCNLSPQWRQRDLNPGSPRTKPICYQLSYPGLDIFWIYFIFRWC